MGQKVNPHGLRVGIRLISQTIWLKIIISEHF